MLNRIIALSLKNRLVVGILALIVVIGGCWVISRTEVDVFPDLNAPTVAVMTEAPGMAAEEVEQRISFPLETALNGVSGMRRIRSNSQTGFSIVWVEFDWATDVYRARQNVAERLAGVELPQGTNRPVMGPPTSVLGEVMFVALTSDSLPGMRLRELADSRVAPRLASLKGVAQVSVIGGGEKEYQILMNPAKMRAYGVGMQAIISALENANMNASGGSLNDYGNEYLLRGIIATSDISQLSKLVVREATADSPGVMLENIAEIQEAPKTPATGVASVNGKSAVLLTITKQPEIGTVKLTEEIDTALKEIKSTLPPEVEMRSDLYRQKTFIDSSIGNIQRSLIEGAIFVCIILFIFLMNPRTTFISIVTIPLALLITLITLHLMKLSINTMSIGGIAIAIGSLVDDAIVDVENVFKRLRQNTQLPSEKRKKKLDVIFQASKEVRMPIFNSTLIIIVSFIPLFFLHGMEGRMLVPLGVAFIISLIASTLVALTFTPVLCSWLIPEEGLASKEPRIVRVMKRFYAKGLNWSLQHPKAIIRGSAIAFAGALALFFTFGQSFLPPFNEGSFTVNVSAYPGISLEESDKIGRQVEQILLSVPEIDHVARKTGRAELDEHALGTNVSEIEAPFILKGRKKSEVANEIRHKLEAVQGANIEVGQPISHRIDAMLSGTEANVAIKLFGTDLSQLHQLAKKIKHEVSEVDGVEDVTVEQRVMRPQIKIEPKREILAHYGISMQDFSKMVQSISGGIPVSEVFEGNMVYPIVVKMNPADVQSIDELTKAPVSLPDCSQIPLGTIADIHISEGPNEIGRENLQRLTVIGLNVEGRDVVSAVNDIKSKLSTEINLPEGYHIEYGGQFESAASATRTLVLASLCSIIAIFILLYNQFKSVSQSAIVLINLPLALIGGVIAIAFSGNVVSIPAIIGFISLFGIATRNGMLLVDRYNELRKEGYDKDKAIVEGSLDRLNPIIMTALTSALALIPLAAGGATPGNEIQSPMAKVILGGLVTSTLLNGFVIPVVYKRLKSNA